MWGPRLLFGFRQGRRSRLCEHRQINSRRRGCPSWGPQPRHSFMRAQTVLG